MQGLTRRTFTIINVLNYITIFQHFSHSPNQALRSFRSGVHGDELERSLGGLIGHGARLRLGDF